MQYVVSIPLDPNLAAFIGKKGSENSITFYNRRLDGGALVGIAPTPPIEERLYALAETMLVGNQIVVSTAVLDKLFGEVVVACSLVEKPVIFTDDSDISQFLKGVSLKGHSIVSRDELLEKLLSHKPADQNSQPRVDIDKSFPVKGVGTIALGIVTRGTVQEHQELFHSSGKKVLVRSIQVQDQDVKSAGTWSRVGLALKNIEHDEIEKGDLLTPDQVVRSQQVRCKVRTTPLSKERIEVGKRYDFVSNFTFAKSQVTSVEKDSIVLKLERNASLMKGDRLFLISDESPRIFASGEVL